VRGLVESSDEVERSSLRGSRTPSASHSTLEDALAPVASDLLVAAEAYVRSVLAAADADAEAELARARVEAARILDEARSEGARAASQVAARDLVEARQSARELVLAARRKAYDAFRGRVVEALEREAAAPGGRWIGERLEELVRARVGGPASSRRIGHRPLTVVAESGNRRAVLRSEDLVDQAIESMAAEIEGLWA
jgi:F0F1-type ATP synthase membrane subunit b/b'